MAVEEGIIRRNPAPLQVLGIPQQLANTRQTQKTAFPRMVHASAGFSESGLVILPRASARLQTPEGSDISISFLLTAVDPLQSVSCATRSCGADMIHAPKN